MLKNKSETIVIEGSARLPENTSAKYVYDFITVELELDPVDLRVVDFSCALLSSSSKKILSQALLEHKIEEGIENAIEQLQKRFFSSTKKALIAAIQDAYRCYKTISTSPYAVSSRPETCNQRNL